MSASTESLTETLAVEGRVPDFFIVGQPKSGTTALYRMLGSHPQIYLSDMKEPLFFARDLRPDLRADEGDHDKRPLFPATFAQYLSLFTAAGAEQRVGEASSSYLRSSVAAGAIAEAQPAARIIAIIREPASLLRSLHLQRLQEHIETEPDLARALALEDERRQGMALPARLEQPQMLLYSEFVRTVEQLRRYDAVFATEQIKVLIYDDFRNDNGRAVRDVLRFLEVDDAFPIAQLKANPTVTVRSRRVERAVRRMHARPGAMWAPVNALVKSVTSRPLRKKIRDRLIYRRAQPADERLMMELRRRFAPEVVALSEYLGRDLCALWGYDRLG
jgi:Sulfotransferase family